MAIKYTILKVLIRNLIKENHLKKGFTLIELIVGLLIMSIVIGLAINAFVGVNKDFSKDKKDIESSQNLSAILELIGNDIKQAGEGINDNNFPVIEFSFDSNNTTASTAANTNNPQQSSKIIIRKSVFAPLTLCQDITGDGTALSGTISVADNAVTNSNCKLTAAVPILFPPSGVTSSPFNTLISTREYRCQLDQLNSDYLSTTSDLCNTASSNGSELLRAAISDNNGHIRTFNYYDDNFNVTSSPNQYYIKTAMTTSDPTDIARNKTVSYSASNNLPIYFIEERIYVLDNNGNLTLAINGGTPQTLIKKISQFNISARLYTNTLDRIVNTAPTVPTVTAPATTISNTNFICPTNPQYICQFNYNTLATDVAMNWKQLAGVRVSLQTRYDGTGQNATASTTDKNKLQAVAEFFPRNVLSK